jgi:hypothetical protein
MASLPHEHLERATTRPRTEQQRQPLPADVHRMPTWGTFDVTGPTEFTDLRGRTRNGYRATTVGRRPFDTATTVTPPGHVSTVPG